MIEYPIEGPWRLNIFTVEWIISMLFFELGVIFLYRYLGKRDKLGALQERAFSTLCFGFSVMYIFFVLADFIMETNYYRILLNNTGYLLGMIFLLFFFLRMEEYRNFLGKITLYKIQLVLISLTFILMVFNLEIALEIIRWFFWIPLLLFFILYIKFLIENRNIMNFKSDSMKIIYFFISGLICFIVGILLTMEFNVQIFGWGIGYFGSLSIILGLTLFASFFLSVPTLSEYDWKDKIEEIFIILKSGICIYHNDLLSKKTEEISRSQPLAGGLKSLEIILSQISSSRSDSVLYGENKYLIIKPREFITGVIVSKADLYSIRFLLNILLRKIEVIYLPIFANKKYSETKIFRPIEDIVRETLSL